MNFNGVTVRRCDESLPIAAGPARPGRRSSLTRKSRASESTLRGSVPRPRLQVGLARVSDRDSVTLPGTVKAIIKLRLPGCGALPVTAVRRGCRGRGPAAAVRVGLRRPSRSVTDRRYSSLNISLNISVLSPRVRFGHRDGHRRRSPWRPPSHLGPGLWPGPGRRQLWQLSSQNVLRFFCGFSEAAAEPGQPLQPSDVL